MKQTEEILHAGRLNLASKIQKKISLIQIVHIFLLLETFETSTGRNTQLCYPEESAQL